MKTWLLLLALLLGTAFSLWLSPAPQGAPDVEYWGEYVRVAPGLGFVLNHDSQGYIDAARYPSQLLRPGEVRQSRPLYILLGTAVGYPLATGLRLGSQLGLLPPWWPETTCYWGFYGGYVLLNALALLASLGLLRWLVAALAGCPARRWVFWPLAWVLVANPITKAFFWTAHQQMLAFLVPLFCLALALWVARRPAPGWLYAAALSAALGVLPLLYGSFGLAWPALAFGLGAASLVHPRARAARFSARLAGQLLLSLALFAAPTLLWIGLLRLHGTTYYNHEAVRYHQLVWLLEACHLPLAGYLALVGRRLAEYLGSLQLIAGWLLLGLGLLAATWWRTRRVRPAQALLPALPGRALAFTFACFGGFFALLGYYPERLAYTLLPLVLCLLAGLLPHWPPRRARWLALAGAAGWYGYVLLSYGPFS
ncbi:hypothetical protein HHL22_15215 [Hymenobacter sp. RP-2-7]|uniref:Glycosyltransferase RgtA/B/C/D-like domain-containing protein n=1 Tax=Hymenobacter polaris TaxID=2682546 RepID=A0A7Y0AG44_9BACT|nr:hypothetical protein [Hymenobacter polaris]NML66557.1 hypothetical protein [Hymenobacter polaris]